MSEMVSDAERYVSLRKQALEAQAKANELHVAVQKLRTYMIQQYPKATIVLPELPAVVTVRDESVTIVSDVVIGK